MSNSEWITVFEKGQNQSDYFFGLCTFSPTRECALAVSFLPIQQSMVEVFTEALQDPVMIPDGWSLIFTGRKVTLQL